MKRILLILICCLVPVIMASGQEQQAQKLLSEAIYQEEVKGDLDNAIKTYQLILSKYPDNRKVSAEVLLHLGMCYEKLGNQEAVKTYKRLVNNFPEQKNQVTIARERLTRLIQAAEKVLATSPTPKFTKIKIPTKLSWSVKLAPDGKNLALVSESKLWVMPLSGNIGPDFPGKPVQINTEDINVEWSGLAWSGDGKWIAFNEELAKKNLVEKPEKEKYNQGIFIVPSNGGKPKKVIENYRDARVVNYRISLSPDASKLAYTSVENNEQHVYTTQVDGGLPKKLVDIQAREPVFSPDGKMIAFVEDKNLGRGEGGLGLWVTPAQGGTSHLLADAKTASSPVWSPDGSRIAFIDISNKKQINLVDVPKDWKAAGKVTSINAPENTEEVTLLAGWTPDNKIGLLITSKRELSLYTLPAKGGQAAIISNDCYAFQPRWSLDGKKIFYVTPPAEGENKFHRLTLASVSASGGIGKPILKEHDGKVIGQLPYQSGNRVSPDGKMMISSAYISSDTMGVSEWPNSKIWEISIDGKESKQITNQEGRFADMCPSWSPDGKKIAFIRAGLKDNLLVFDKVSMYTISSSGGEPKMLIPETDNYIFSPVWSPDGKMIAYMTKDKETTSEAPTSRYMNVVNVENGSTRVVGEVPKAHVNVELAWSPDSKRIAFNGDNVIKVMNIDDGKIEDIKTNLADVEIWHLDWSRDGEQFVFSGMKGGTAEFWFLEDFMPLEKLAQKHEKENVKEPEGIRIKQIWKEPYTDYLGTVSYDGRLRAYVYWGNGDVAVQNIITGENQILTHTADLGDSIGFAEEPLISKNGKQIVYSWWNPYNTSDLFIIDVDNPLPRHLYRQEGEEVYPVAWLSDKEIVVTRYNTKTETAQITSFNISDGTFHVLKTFDRKKWPQLSCSPDGKSIAFDFANETDNGNFDINILPVDGSNEISIVRHPANDRVLGWVPGRNEFLFISDRSGSLDLWAMPLHDGKPSGLPKRIYTDIGEMKPMGFTQNGDCFVGFSRQNFNTYIAPFNAETGELKEASGKSIIGSNYWVKWSPDRQYLVYTKERQLTVQDLKTGSERKLADNMFFATTPCWSPDGNSILFVGFEQSKLQTKGYKGGIYMVNVKTGQTTEIVLISDYEYHAPEDDSLPLSDLEWSSDGKSIFFLFFKDWLIKHNLETGEDKILYKHSLFERGVLKLSPDGKSLLLGLRYPGDEKSRLLTIPVEGGNEKQVCTAQEDKVFGRALWSPDGKYIYFTENREKPNLWRVPAEGGKPQKVWHSENMVEIFSFHPDGNQIAFSIRERTTEVRVIENLVQELEKLEKLP